MAGVLCFNFFFLPPLFTFYLADTQNWVALVAFLITAVVASQLSTSAKNRALDAMRQREEVERLYELSRVLIDFETRKVRAGNKNARLTPKEFDLLRYLASQRGKPVPHRELLQAVWGPDYGDQTDYLRVFITHLRKKIEPNPAKPKYILTEPWLGYRFGD